MKKLKGILGIVLAACIIMSCFSLGFTANAAETSKAKTGQPVSLQDNVEDGVILHALCWSYADIEKNIPAIAAAGYSAVQVSPVQQPKDYSTSTNVSGQWWKFYQPVSLSIAKKSWAGTATELKSLCTAAHKAGVKIICDVVTNHLGADDDAGPTRLAAEVKTYMPSFYGSNGAVKGNQYFHDPSLGSASDSDVRSVTQKVSSGCPDLNTGNKTVQNAVAGLLKECINCGADGFRFDAAKHIETPSDSISPNDYWPTIISQANSAAGSKKIFYYGEVLNTAGGGRSISGYTNLNGGKYRITDNKASSGIRNGVVGHNAANAVKLDTSLSGGASHAVTWVESHDTYLNTDAGNTTDISDTDIIKAWALVAAHKDTTPLFFARTNGMKMGEAAKNTSYKSVAVAEANKFHNNFVGQAEKTGSSGNFAWIARGNKGIVIVNVNGTTASASVSGTGLADGAYKDMVTGADFTVKGGTVSGKIGASGVAVVMQDETTPAVFADVESGNFSGNTLTVGLSLVNATSGTYQLENYAPVKFTGSPKIKIGSDYNYGETITLKLTATDGKNTSETTYKYTKKEAASSGVYIIVPASAVSSAGWKAPLYAYLYDQTSGNGGKVGGMVYKNAAWPGEQLEYDENLKAYYLEVDGKNAVAEKTVTVDKSGNVTKSESAGTVAFDLAHSKNTHVIVNDSSKDADGKSQGKQFPPSGSKSTLDLGGSSKKLTALKGSAGPSIFVNTTEKPGQQKDVPATEVKKGGEPATEAPTTANPTEAPTTDKPTEATVKPITGDLIYGDSNQDGNVSIKDATVIQEHAAKLKTLTGNALAVSDVNGDGNVNVKDATCIQKHLAKLSGAGYTGQPYTGEVKPATEPETKATQAPAPTEAPTQAPTEAPTEEATEAPTEPAPTGTYTVYVKTKLSWLSSQLTEPYLYDNASGESYLLTRDTSVAPYCFTADVPGSFGSATFYRAKAPADPSEGEAGGVYNVINGLEFSTTDNCYTLEDFPMDGDAVGSMGPYVAEEDTGDSLSTLYVKDDAGWGNVFFYGWGLYDNSDTIASVKVKDNIYKIELDPPLIPGVVTFLLKNTAGNKTWDKQTDNLAAETGKNMFVLSSNTWETYSE